MKCGFVITAVLISTISSHAIKEVEPESSQASSKELSPKSAQETEEKTAEDSTIPVAVVEDSKTGSESTTNAEQDLVKNAQHESVTELQQDSVREAEQESVTALEKDSVRKPEEEAVRAEQDDGTTRNDRSTVSVLDTFEAERKSSSTTGDADYTDEQSTQTVQFKNAAVEDATEKSSKQDEELSVRRPENGFETKVKDTKSGAEEAKANPKSLDSKQGVDEDDSYESKFGEDYSSTSSEPVEESTVTSRRMLSPKIIDSKARSGFEANADEAGNIQVTDDDASEDVRSAMPFESPRRFIGGARYFPATLTRQLVRPKLVLKPIIRPVLPRYFEYPTPESYKLFQNPTYQNPPPLEAPEFKEFFPNTFERNNYKNSYPYEAPLVSTSPKPFTNKFPSFDNLLPSPNLDKLFFKLSQASHIPKLSPGFPSLFQPSPPPISFPSYLGYSQAK